MLPAQKNSMLDLRGVKTPAIRALEKHAVDLRAPAEVATCQMVHNVPAATKKQETQSLTPQLFRVFSIVLVVVASWHYLPLMASSLAYFSDTEASDGMMRASILDIDAQGGGSETLACGESTRFTVDTVLTATRPANYSVTLENATGTATLCEKLEVEARLDGTRLFPSGGSPYLLDLYVPSATSSGQWTFDVTLPLGAQDIPNGSTCTVDIVFRAWCPYTGDYGDGFSDEDRVSVTVTKEGCTDPGCEPCTSGNCGEVTIVVENHNDATIVNNVVTTSSTGGNSAGGGGTVTTGDASSVVEITNVVNTNITNIDVSSCCSSCGCENDCTQPCDASDCTPDSDSGCDENSLEEYDLQDIEALGSDIQDGNDSADTEVAQDNDEVHDRTTASLEEVVEEEVVPMEAVQSPQPEEQAQTPRDLFDERFNRTRAR